MLDSDQIQPFEPEVQESGPKRHTEANTALFLGIASVVLAAGALGLACAVSASSLRAERSKITKNIQRITPLTHIARQRRGLYAQ
ncbi:MAG: hypothetical protein DCO96_12875 [Fluviicola sp. XM-24bin1]|nr:MAG: hypothetical protein DCO96_12875 [Fluviicola sp. XM-24bin1]